MKNFIVVLFLLLLSCTTPYISPHTKIGQAKITLDRVHTPYYIQYLTLSGIVPFHIKWTGSATMMIIEAQFIIRPTSPRVRFPLFTENLQGNYYTVYKQKFYLDDTQELEGKFTVFHPGDYKLKVTIINKYWSETRYSNFKVY